MNNLRKYLTLMVIGLWMSAGSHAQTADCTATYNPDTGKLHIPCVAVTGNEESVFQVDMLQTPLFNFISVFNPDMNSIRPAEPQPGPETPVVTPIKSRQYLVLSHLAPGVTQADIAPYTKAEAELAWKYYEQGINRQMWWRTDEPGVAIIMESNSVEEAHTAVSAMPMIANGFIEYDLIPLAYFSPFSTLFSEEVDLEPPDIPQRAARAVTPPATGQYLVISRLAAGVTFEDLAPYSKAESERAWQYYVEGINRQFWTRSDEGGVVILLESHSMEEAHEAISTMPMIANNLVEYDLVPLTHFFPFTALFATEQ